MTMRFLDPGIRLVKLLGLLASSHDGERAAAGLKADQLIRERGLQWTDVICLPSLKPEPLSWRDMVQECLNARSALNSAEISFLRSLRTWRGTPTPKQMAWLERIFEAVVMS